MNLEPVFFLELGCAVIDGNLYDMSAEDPDMAFVGNLDAGLPAKFSVDEVVNVMVKHDKIIMDRGTMNVSVFLREEDSLIRKLHTLNLASGQIRKFMNAVISQIKIADREATKSNHGMDKYHRKGDKR